MEGTVQAAGAIATTAPEESMKDYVIRRAFELKRYQEHAEKIGVSWHWLRKLATGRLPNPNYNDVERCWNYYRALEAGAGT